MKDMPTVLAGDGHRCCLHRGKACSRKVYILKLQNKMVFLQVQADVTHLQVGSGNKPGDDSFLKVHSCISRYLSYEKSMIQVYLYKNFRHSSSVPNFVQREPDKNLHTRTPKA